MKLKNSIQFFRQLRHGFQSVGAVAPTSKDTSKAIVRECKRHKGPKRILEVGAGTGAVTEELVKLLGPKDQLIICELNDKYVDFLENRFREEESFRQVADRCHIIHGSITDFDTSEPFDLIISTLPFNNFPASLVDEIFKQYQSLLKPGGTITYIEYAYFRDFFKDSSFYAHKERLAATNELLSSYINRYQIRKDLIWANIPPTWVRVLRFGEPNLDTLKDQPENTTHRTQLGPIQLVSDGMPFVVGCLGMAALDAIRGGNKWGWWLAGASVIGLFHRDPIRQIDTNQELLLSACDGKVTDIDRTTHPRYPDKKWVRVITFLGVQDIHINRSPFKGEVVDRWFEPGSFSPAFREDSYRNTSHYLALQTEIGMCLVVQRSGILARAIQCWVQPGDMLSQGERFGLIHFGSRTDLYLPEDKVKILVQRGDRVVAGKTPIARIIKD